LYHKLEDMVIFKYISLIITTNKNTTFALSISTFFDEKNKNE